MRGSILQVKAQGCSGRFLIINADDFGLTDGVSQGIAESLASGTVSSTTAMLCAPGSQKRIEKWIECLRGRVGVHLQLTGGRPISPVADVPSLVGSDEHFYRSASDIDPLFEDVVVEWRSQVERLRELGLQPTHLDTHHHVHRHPVAFAGVLAVAEHYDLPVRTLSETMTDRIRARGVRCSDKTILEFYGAPPLEKVLSLLDSAFETAPCTVELMCHPGIVNDDLRRTSSYVDERGRELTMLNSPDFLSEVAARNIEIVKSWAVLR